MELAGPIEHRESQPIPLRRVGDGEVADRLGQIRDIALLEAQDVRIVRRDQRRQFSCGAVLLQVV